MAFDKGGKYHANPAHAKMMDSASASKPAPAGGEPDADEQGAAPAAPMGGDPGGGDLVTQMAQMAEQSGDMGLAEYIMAYPGAQPQGGMAAPAAHTGAAPALAGY